jgi:ribonuclease Z
MLLNISGYSTALFSTWYFIDELGILLDCGDGCIAGLLQKSRKVKHIFISHADRDHLTGLLQFSQLNNRGDYPLLFYPYHCGSFPALQAFSEKFDPHIPKAKWTGVNNREEIKIGKDIIVTAIRNNHVPVLDDCYKSLGYLIERTKRKLKDEYTGLSGKDIAELRKTKGDDEITYEVREKLVAYSGDTPAENSEHWEHSNILIHESTFLSEKDMGDEQPRANKHSSLEEVIKMASSININHLVLGHFSSRYSDEEIVAAIQNFAKMYMLKCNVYAVLPGQFYKNIFENKIYSPVLSTKPL